MQGAFKTFAAVFSLVMFKMLLLLIAWLINGFEPGMAMRTDTATGKP
jgi:hypothetical protein